MVSLSREQLVAAELNRDITGFLSKPSNQNHSMARSSHEGSGSPSHQGHSRPKYTSNFAPSSEDRNRPVKTPPGPPPGAYNLQPKWEKATAVVMAPSTVVSKKVHENTPGYAFHFLKCILFCFKSFYFRFNSHSLIQARAIQYFATHGQRQLEKPEEYYVV